jgi:uncharacterized membrane protein YkvA (DUF1232 family)
MNATRMDAARSMLADLKAGNMSALPVKDLLLLLLGVLYLVSPIDFLPEIALGPLGLVDDTGVLALVLVQLTSMLDRRAATMNNAGPSSADWQAPTQASYIPGEVIR